MPIWSVKSNTPDAVANSQLVTILAGALDAASSGGKAWPLVSPAGTTDYADIRAQVAAFQKANSLTVDGDAGSNTCARLAAVGAFGQLDGAKAIAITRAGIQLYNYALITAIWNESEQLASIARTWGNWLHAAAAAGRAKMPDVQRAKLAASSQTVEVAATSKSKVDATATVSRVGFAPAIAIGLVAESAAPALAAEVVAGVGYVAAAAATAWAAVTMANVAKPRTKDQPKDKSISTTTPIEHPVPGGPNQSKWDFKGDPSYWWKKLAALCAAIIAVVVSGLGVVATLLPVAGAAAATGLQVAIAAGGLLLVLLFALRRKARGR
jgi:hypothetical protein